MGSEFKVLGPWADIDPLPLKGIAPRLSDLTGKTIGLFALSKQASRPIVLAVGEKLKARFPGLKTVLYDSYAPWTVMQVNTEDKEKFENWLNGVDAVVAAVGDWGSCTKGLVYEATSMEERNKPSAVLVNEYFLNDALSAASQKGMPGMRIIPEIVPCESMIDTQIETGISAALDDIIAALTRPLSETEKSPKSREAEATSRIIFKGDLKEVNQFFYKRGWTDGFPIIPPTEEEVAEMLTGTDLPPDHIVNKIIPRLGKATIEKIAINAVMAGALPTYMPILIAGVQAVMDPGSNFAAWAFSAGSWSPFWIINGPIRQELNINSGSGVLSPGDIANATIGRAMGLIIKNIGGIRKGIEDMGSLGNPGKYTMVIAENEERSPWEPLHVDFGFKREDSTITLSFPNIYWQMLPSGSDEKSVLSAAVHDIGLAGKGGYYLILSPAAARFLADAGWKKKDVIDIIQKVTAPTGMPSKAPPPERLSYSKSVLSGAASFVQIVVTGGATNAMGFAKGFGVGRVIKKIELPAHWDKLVQKYKNIVPTYSRY